MKILILFTILTFVSCSQEKPEQRISVENTTGKLSDCDTNFINAINAIEKDSFLLMHKSKYYHHLNKCEEHSDSTCFNSKYVFVSEFRNHIETTFDQENYGIDTLFDSTDFSQYPNQNFKIQTNCFPQFNFVSSDTVNSWFGPEHRWPKDLRWFYTFSKPIVSIDRNYMLIEMSGRCGWLCGGFQTFILENTSPGWVVKDQISGGVY